MVCKLKSNKAMAKRIKVTKNGKLMHWKAWKNHLLTNKDKAQRQFWSWKELWVSETKRVKTLIPYKLR